MTLGHVGMINCLWKTRVGVRLLPLAVRGVSPAVSRGLLNLTSYNLKAIACT